MSTNLSNNFTWEEFIYSDTANSRGIDNNPPKEIEEEIKLKASNLCNHLLQPIRNILGPIIISSGYSCPALAKVLGRKENSQHNKGEAADLCFKNIDNLTAAKWIRKNCSFDQLIYEKRMRKNGTTYDWVHVSYKSEKHNRQEVLYSPIGGGYQHGLPLK